MRSYALNGWLQLRWDRIRGSLWFVPAVFVVCAMALAVGMLWLDSHLLGHPAARVWWLFGGNADGARTILSVIAGSLISVVAVVFSITMIALQQAANRYSPRILKTFTQDLGNKIVLGSYIGTFTYSLLVLQRVRGPLDEGGTPFIPYYSLFVAIGLSLVNLGLLVYFIHHVIETLHVSTLLLHLQQEVRQEVEKLFPVQFGVEGEDPPEAARLYESQAAMQRGEPLLIRSEKDGFLRRVDEDVLEKKFAGCCELAAARARIGDFVQRDDVLFAVWRRPGVDVDLEGIRAAVQLDRDRSILQDPLYGIQQLVDVALRALSPALNDPTTAEQVIQQLIALLGDVGRKRFPSPLRRLPDGGHVLFDAPSFADFLDASVSQLRRAARSSPHVMLYLAECLLSLARKMPSRARRVRILRECELVLQHMAKDDLSDAEQRRLEAAWASVTTGAAPDEDAAPAH